MAEAKKVKQALDFSKAKSIQDLYELLGSEHQSMMAISKAIALRDLDTLRILLEKLCGSEKGDEIYNSLSEAIAVQMAHVVPQISNPKNYNTTSPVAFAVSIPPKEGAQFINALGEGNLEMLRSIAHNMLGEKAGAQFIENLLPQLDNYKN